VWRAALDERGQMLTVENVNAWLASTRVVHQEGEVLRVAVPAVFNKIWLEQKLHGKAWCYGARHRGQSSDLWSRDKGPIPLLETLLCPVLLHRGASARVFRRGGRHERSASRRTRYFLLDTNTLIGLFRAQRRLYFAPGVAFRNTRPILPGARHRRR